MGPVWVVLADSQRARVYMQPNRGAPLTVVEELLHEEGGMKASELMTDKPGRRNEANLTGVGGGPGAMSAVRGATVPHTDPEEVEHHRFAKMVARLLDDGRVKNKYAELVLFMAPKTLGHVKKYCDEKTRERIAHAAPEEILQLSPAQLGAKLAREWFVPDQPFAV